MASIKEKHLKNGKVKYEITVSLGRSPNGKKIFKTVIYEPKAKYGTKKCNDEVIAYASVFEKECRDGDVYDGEKITYADFAETWKEEWLPRNVTLSQQEGYYAILRNHVLPAIGHLKISKIKTAHCQKILYDAEEKKGLKPKTVRRIYTSMNSVFKYAKRMQIIKANPCIDCIQPKLNIDRTQVHNFTLEQSKRFLECLSLSYPVEYGKRKRQDSNGNEYEVKGYKSFVTIPYQFQVFFTLASYSGARRSELLALTWNDIDFINHKLNITKAVAMSKGQLYIKPPKTTAGIRTITLPYVCFDMLKTWKEQEKSICISSSDWKGKDIDHFDEQPIFIQENGEIMHPSTPTHKFKEILLLHNKNCKEEDTLPLIKLHDLRHTSASLLISEGTDIATVSKRLGHSEVSTTLNVYTHALAEKDEEASNTLEKLYKSGNTHVPTVERIEVSTEERKLLEAIRNADKPLQELLSEMLQEKYTLPEILAKTTQVKSGSIKMN